MSRIRPYSDRRRHRDRDYPQARQAVHSRTEGRCEVLALGCTWRMTDVHHIEGRAGPDPHRLENLLGCCRNCHELIHMQPEWARERGYVRSRMAEVTPPRWAQEDAS